MAMGKKKKSTRSSRERYVKSVTPLVAKLLRGYYNNSDDAVQYLLERLLIDCVELDDIIGELHVLSDMRKSRRD
jgi:hypothetical protein